MECKRCPFCEVATGLTDHDCVYEDDELVAFLCEPPATWGHTLVVPRAHTRDIWSIGPDQAAAAMALAHRLAKAMRDELGAVGVNLRQNSGARAGQDVFHFHLHVVPRYEDDTVLPGCVLGEAALANRQPAALRSNAASPTRSAEPSPDDASELDRRHVELVCAFHRRQCDREILDR